MSCTTTLAPTSSKSTLQVRIPWLPCEIWVLVMGHLVNNKDFPDAWFACRRASRTLKRAIELAFLGEALPEIEINLSLIGSFGRNYAEVARLEFKCFSEDGNRVHYGEPGAAKTALPRSPPSLIDHEPLAETENTSSDFGNPPMLIEWASKIYISVCRGPTSYYSWSDGYRDQLRHVWLKPGSDKTMRVVVDHKRREVSFCWKPMLTAFFSRLSQPKQVSREVHWLKMNKAAGTSTGGSSSRAEETDNFRRLSIQEPVGV
ncbi:hypothetical protein JX265_000529 [Neoarthrinium moseri]|uniref:Uncharacterized protein n=1 Tax=Neoarthrinium moseri TaxID=1658444 RepID=A0A9Q0AV00_9PEZI|nr:hypothetical protein JX265_000529 [Neoarthrinium moseri]